MDNYKELIDRYNAKTADGKDIAEIEALLEEGVISLTFLQDISVMQQHLESVPSVEPSYTMDAKFHTMLAKEKNKVSNAFSKRLSEWWASAWQFEMQWAYSLVLILLGGTGVYVWQGASHDKIDQLTSEMGEMKEIMMLSMLEQNSTTERLKAVSLTNDMVEVSDKVATALIETLRHDDNNSVRLAAVEALALYTDDAEVRKGLIASIQYQKSPLVQLALAELMVALKEKKSVTAFKDIIESDETPSEIKVALENAMQVLI